MVSLAQIFFCLHFTAATSASRFFSRSDCELKMRLASGTRFMGKERHVRL
jgi:hypothetical protein